MALTYDFAEISKEELFLTDIFQNNLGYSKEDAYVAVSSIINQDFI